MVQVFYELAQLVLIFPWDFLFLDLYIKYH